MKFYKITGNSEYGEQPARDARTGESVTITDNRIALNAGDYIKIYRCNVVEERGTQEAFQFHVMPDAYSLFVYVCDFETGAQVIEQHLRPLLGEMMYSATLDAILNRLQNKYMTVAEA